MYSLIYRSVARESFTMPLIYKMLSGARDFNAAHDITGCLLYHKGQFIQLLEGDYNEVRALYERIEKDERHEQVELLEEEEVSHRIFNEWSMAFQDVGDEQLTSNFKELLLYSYFDKSRIYELPSKTALALFKGIRKILKTD